MQEAVNRKKVMYFPDTMQGNAVLDYIKGLPRGTANAKILDILYEYVQGIGHRDTAGVLITEEMIEKIAEEAARIVMEKLKEKEPALERTDGDADAIAEDIPQDTAEEEEQEEQEEDAGGSSLISDLALFGA